MSRIITRTAAAAVAAAALLSVTGTAQAADLAPTKADRAAVKVANKVCAPVQDDVSWEECVVGEFSQQTGRVINGHDYVADSGKLELVYRSHAVRWQRATKASSKDQRALKAAWAQAEYGVDRELDGQFMDVVVGDFMLYQRPGHYISADWIELDSKGQPHLTQHSRLVRR